MHGAQASLAQLVFDAEGEVGSIDADHHIRPGLDERADQPLAPSQQPGSLPSTSTRPITDRRSMGK